MLVYTPKGNIPVVGDYLHHAGLYLDHPAPGEPRMGNYPYHNPHNPPPGGFNRPGACRPGGYAGSSGMANRRWGTPAVNAKSVEVQRSQVDELFRSLKDDSDELIEMDPRTCVQSLLVVLVLQIQPFSSRGPHEVIPSSEEGFDIPTRARARDYRP